MDYIEIWLLSVLSISLRFHFSWWLLTSIAKEAVELDEKGEYSKALTLYSVCTTLITSEINVYLQCIKLLYRHGILAVMKQSKKNYQIWRMLILIVWIRFKIVNFDTFLPIALHVLFSLLNIDRDRRSWSFILQKSNGICIHCSSFLEMEESLYSNTTIYNDTQCKWKGIKDVKYSQIR